MHWLLWNKRGQTLYLYTDNLKETVNIIYTQVKTSNIVIVINRVHRLIL